MFCIINTKKFADKKKLQLFYAKVTKQLVRMQVGVIDLFLLRKEY